MKKKLPIEDIKINEANIQEFKRYHTQGKFHCCLCKRKVFADESYSNRGDRLICHQCHYEIFENVVDARKWMNREV